MQKMFVFIFAEAGLLCTTVVVNAMTNVAPIWIWAVGIPVFFAIAVAIAAWPWRTRLSPRKQLPRLNAWVDSDDSLTLEQAAFLWEGILHQEPMPALAQNRMAHLLNAVQTGALKGFTPPSTFAGSIVFAILGKGKGKDEGHYESLSRATRVHVKKLKHYAKSIGDVPAFLDHV